MFAQAIGTMAPHAATPAQADQWRVPFAQHLQQASFDEQPGRTQQIRLGGIDQPALDDPA